MKGANAPSILATNKQVRTRLSTALTTMGFTYYFMKALKIALIFGGLTNMSALLLYSLLTGFFEERILGFQMSTPSAICMGCVFLISFGWSLSLIYDEIIDMIKTKCDWDKFDDLLSQEQWDKARELIKNK